MALTQAEIDKLNHYGAEFQKLQLGTVLSNIEGGVVAAGSISTAELADGVLSADATGRAKMANGFVTATQIANATITTTQISATAAITGSQLSATADIAGTQLAAAANIAGTQLAAAANIAGSQLSATAGIVGTQLASSTIADSNLVVVPFTATATLTAAAAATPVDIVATASVPAGKKIYITSMLMAVNGGTAWTDVTATVVTLQDKAGAPVLALTAAKAQLTANAVLDLVSTGITLAAPVLTGVGLTAAVGLTIKGDANFAAGSDIVVTVSGFIKA